MIEYILWGIFTLLLIQYTLFLFLVLKGLNNLKPASQKNISKEFVSIIIPFRNESENITNSVSGILKQNYPVDKFEVIYVDDNSTDDSFIKINEYPKPENVKVLSLPDDYLTVAHKKRAISFGIENAKGDIIVTTDADCFYNENWLRSLLSNLDHDTGFVSGPVEFIEEDTFFSGLQKLEFAGLILTGAGLIGINKPTICNAANIAYRRKTYEDVKGFQGNMKLSSGDDELLMQKIARETDYKVRFSLTRDSIVRTKGNPDLNKFYHQRKRWASKGLFYKNKSLIFMLVMIFLFYTGLLVQPILSLFLFPTIAITFACSILTKLLFEYMILKKGKRLLFKNLSLKSFLMAEVIQVPYIVVAGFTGLFGNLEWKGRSLRR
ncbi:MAG: glycosyltransferase [Ignavibacteria bacterium]|jgi:cellulose synthase/poly-beta-1,6-N-acetylglucosamine synthase-like glycosyltransferase